MSAGYSSKFSILWPGFDKILKTAFQRIMYKDKDLSRLRLVLKSTIFFFKFYESKVFITKYIEVKRENIKLVFQLQSKWT